MASVEADQPMTPWHVLHSASVVKLYVTAQTMLLVEEGRLDLDEPMAEHLPPDLVAGVDHGDEITIRQLLNHTSGVYDYFNSPAFFLAYLDDPLRVWTVEEYLDIVQSHQARFAPGESWSYSNSNYLLLSLIIDELTGDHAQHLQDEMLAPLGLEHTWYKVQPGYPSPPGLVNAYADLEGRERLVNISDVYEARYSLMQGDDGLMAGATDYGRLAQALFQGEIVSASSLEAMTTWEGIGLEGLSYGLGLIRDERVGHTAVGHSGSTDASGAMVFWFEEEQTVVVLLVDSSLNDPWGSRFTDGFWPAMVDEAL